MEIMNYNQMVENLKAIEILSRKTIECSKDYVDTQKGRILDQMAEYIYKTLKDIMTLDVKQQSVVISYIMKYVRGIFSIKSSNYLINGLTATVQISFTRFNQDRIELYMKHDGYWFEHNNLTDEGLKYLIRYWDEAKEGMHAGIKEGMHMLSIGSQSALKNQLELHNAVKNFKI